MACASTARGRCRTRVPRRLPSRDVSLRRGTTAAFRRALGRHRCSGRSRRVGHGVVARRIALSAMVWRVRVSDSAETADRSRAARSRARGVDAFHTHLGPSLSFAMINLGFEPLHSTTVVINGHAVALMGDCGYGKSSLGASFVKAGYRLLTDDLLVTSFKDGRFLAYPGAPRVKLYPAIAKSHLRAARERPAPGTAHAEAHHPAGRTRSQRTPVPLKAIYVLRPPGPRTPRASPSGSCRTAARSSSSSGTRSTWRSAIRPDWNGSSRSPRISPPTCRSSRCRIRASSGCCTTRARRFWRISGSRTAIGGARRPRSDSPRRRALI